jgi:hypothetical protein
MTVIGKNGEIIECKSDLSKTHPPSSKEEEEYNQSVEFEMKINNLCEEKKLASFFKKLFK